MTTEGVLITIWVSAIVAAIAVAGSLLTARLTNRHQRKLADLGLKLEAWATLAGALPVAHRLLAERADARIAGYCAQVALANYTTGDSAGLGRERALCREAVDKADHEITALVQRLSETTAIISRLWPGPRTFELILSMHNAWPADPKIPGPLDSVRDPAGFPPDHASWRENYLQAYAPRLNAYLDSFGELLGYVEGQLDKEDNRRGVRAWLAVWAAVKKRYLHFEQVVFFRGHPLP